MKSQAKDLAARELPGNMVPRAVEGSWVLEGPELADSGLDSGSGGNRFATKPGHRCGEGILRRVAVEDLSRVPVATGDVVDEIAKAPLCARRREHPVAVLDYGEGIDEVGRHYLDSGEIHVVGRHAASMPTTETTTVPANSTGSGER